jgi:hypothetical protein
VSIFAPLRRSYVPPCLLNKNDIAAAACIFCASLPLVGEASVANLTAFAGIAFVSVWNSLRNPEPYLRVAHASSPAIEDVRPNTSPAPRASVEDRTPNAAVPEAMESLDEAVEREQRIAVLQSSSRHLSDLSSTIRVLTAQMQLVAANAAIEAAVAGENGRDFGVIAREMQKLADQSDKVGTGLRSAHARIDAFVHGERLLATNSASN